VSSRRCILMFSLDDGSPVEVTMFLLMLFVCILSVVSCRIGCAVWLL